MAIREIQTKPVSGSAVQWDGTNQDEVVSFYEACLAVHSHRHEGNVHRAEVAKGNRLWLWSVFDRHHDIPQSFMSASDWLVRVGGGFAFKTDAEFRDEFDLIDNAAERGAT